MVPPAKDPNYVSRENLGLVPTLWPGQDELGFATKYQTMFMVHLLKKLYNQQWPEEQQVDGPCPRPFFAP